MAEKNIETERPQEELGIQETLVKNALHMKES